MQDDRRLGLRRGTVRIASYDPAWAELYRAIFSRVREALAGLSFDIEHVGSTSVPGLDAKPIVDVAIAVPEGEMPDALTHLTSAGFEYRSDQGEHGGHVLVECHETDWRVAHLHVVATDSRQWHDYLRFRERLRADADLRREYAALKRHLAAVHADDRVAYTAAKTDFVTSSLEMTRRH